MPEETILVVDDEIANLQKLRRTFAHRYPILAASSGSEAIKILNTNLLERYPANNYIAVAYCRLDLESGAGVLANGGMPFPFLLRKNVAVQIQIGGVPLGLMPDSFYENVIFQLAPGDALILSSDGTTDAMNPSGEFYDVKRFIESICRNNIDNVSDFIKVFTLKFGNSRRAQN